MSILLVLTATIPFPLLAARITLDRRIARRRLVQGVVLESAAVKNVMRERKPSWRFFVVMTIAVVANQAAALALGAAVVILVLFRTGVAR